MCRVNPKLLFQRPLFPLAHTKADICIFCGAQHCGVEFFLPGLNATSAAFRVVQQMVGVYPAQLFGAMTASPVDQPREHMCMHSQSGLRWTEFQKIPAMRSERRPTPPLQIPFCGNKDRFKVRVSSNCEEVISDSAVEMQMSAKQYLSV